MTGPLLAVEDLSIDLRSKGQASAPVVDGLSFTIGRGETLALVGESGCGKSVSALAILRLLDPPLFATRGKIVLEGRDLAALPERELYTVRGRRIAMIFQEPMTALNPVMTVGDQIAEGMIVHERLPEKEARRRTLELMREVGIADVEQRIDRYPHEMSGGMRQRVMIAMALACSPDLLLADEPTTALDVTVQAQILALLRGLKEKRGLSILLITHDLGVVAEMADRVAVMYAGRIVEEATVLELFDRPAHPYTQALFRSRPQHTAPGSRLVSIEGTVPAIGRFPSGCRFHPRCVEAESRCTTISPESKALSDAPDHHVACLLREARLRGATA